MVVAGHLRFRRPKAGPARQPPKPLTSNGWLGSLIPAFLIGRASVIRARRASIIRTLRVPVIRIGAALISMAIESFGASGVALLAIGVSNRAHASTSSDNRRNDQN